MLSRVKLSVLLQGLILCLLARTGEASSLGFTVHVVPLNSNGEMVRAHFSVITPSPCPDLSGVCAGEPSCQPHLTSNPFTGSLPAPGWCVRQWQTTLPSVYKKELSLGTTRFNVTINAEPKIRSSNGKLNQPAYVALQPPLRAQENCPRDFQLSVKDLDGDRVQCRLAREDKGECYNCSPHSFLELDEAKCKLTFTGKASPGTYFIDLMVEDYIPMPKSVQILENKPLSSVPVQLSLTVESSTDCGSEHVPTVAPQEDLLFVLPYQEMKIDVSYLDMRSVAEFAVVGPPQLYNKSDLSKNQMTLAWVRSENNLPRLLPICFAANNPSLQSRLQCVWLYQREMTTLPPGTELKCDRTEMILVLPLASIPNVVLAELQPNSSTCPLTSNSTHLTAKISLNGCGTQAVHSGSELVYTNTLRSVHQEVVRRMPSLVLPLACRIRKVQAKGKGSNYTVIMPKEEAVFGNVNIWIEVHQPGEGNFSRYTRNPRFLPNGQSLARARRDTVSTKITSRITQLDLYLMSNCSITDVKMIVTECVESETKDFEVSHPIVAEGCMSSSSTSEIAIDQSTARVYRLNVDSMAAKNSDLMYIMCHIRLCMPTSPSAQCLNVCGRAGSQSPLVTNFMSKTYTVFSDKIPLIPLTPLIPLAPSITTPTTTSPPTNSTTAKNPSIPAGVNSHAPTATSVTTAAILTTISIFLQKTILY